MPVNLKQTQPRVEEEEDLDDLDDVIDQFSQPQPSASTSTAPEPAVSTADKDTEDSEQDRLAAAWEAMLIECMNGMQNPSTTKPASTASPRPGDTFQSSVLSGMHRRREGEPELRSSDSSAGGDTLASLLAQLGADAGDGPEGEEELLGILESMMGGLMSKEVLYEPLKELHEKFPGYLADHANTLSPSDKTRFEAQMSCIKRLLDAFDDPAYRDEDSERIVELMTELQSHGSPPEDVMGPLPPGFNPDGCVCT